MNASAPLLIVEDDQSLRTVLSHELARMGFVVHALADGRDAVAAVRQHDPDCVLLDLHLPGVAGMDLLPKLLAQEPDLRVVVFTGHGTVPLAVQAMRAGAFDFLTKPVSLDLLEQTIRRAVGSAQLLRTNRRLQRAVAGRPPAGMVLGSAAAQKLLAAIGKIARAEQPVLIRGESGSGKELAARELHAQSRRAAEPFVVVNCGAVPKNLIESELFGHVKGAFTGADSKRLGLFEAAAGGTLFLDEVGELPLELQPALLRAIQFGEVRPVGSDQVRKVDVRVLAATHRDLQAWLQDGRFREDLYYRLAVLELWVPPLRDRADDIVPLAQLLLQQQATRAGRELRFAPEALAVLQGHAWPGNVRELENAIVRLCVLADGPEISAADVHEFALQHRQRAAATTLPTLEIRELERLAITEAMRRFGGSKRKAAEALGVALKTLYNKLNAADGSEPGGDEPEETP
ncbi:MAG: sigma-54-dependent Fis family transcriptional regulator [Planctomycetes bacterium]|nr:sigma-54-dependent Fis family transcriptional regulator [Planctomycetota bacterium]